MASCSGDSHACSSCCESSPTQSSPHTDWLLTLLTIISLKVDKRSMQMLRRGSRSKQPVNRLQPMMQLPHPPSKLGRTPTPSSSSMPQLPLLQDKPLSSLSRLNVRKRSSEITPHVVRRTTIYLSLDRLLELQYLEDLAIPLS